MSPCAWRYEMSDQRDAHDVAKELEEWIDPAEEAFFRIFGAACPRDITVGEAHMLARVFRWTIGHAMREPHNQRWGRYPEEGLEPAIRELGERVLNSGANKSGENVWSAAEEVIGKYAPHCKQRAAEAQKVEVKDVREIFCDMFPT